MSRITIDVTNEEARRLRTGSSIMKGRLTDRVLNQLPVLPKSGDACKVRSVNGSSYLGRGARYYVIAADTDQVWVKSSAQRRTTRGSLVHVDRVVVI